MLNVTTEHRWISVLSSGYVTFMPWASPDFECSMVWPLYLIEAITRIFLLLPGG